MTAPVYEPGAPRATVVDHPRVRNGVRPCGCRPELCVFVPESDPRRADRLCKRGRALLDAQLAAERALVNGPRDRAGASRREALHAVVEAARGTFRSHFEKARRKA